MFVVDCLTLWLSNVLLDPRATPERKSSGSSTTWGEDSPDTILVTNEVGLWNRPGERPGEEIPRLGRWDEPGCGKARRRDLLDGFWRAGSCEGSWVECA